jgi:GNAT superfamily N-acetyltransferase
MGSESEAIKENLVLEHYLRSQFPDIRSIMVCLYREIYAEELSRPFFSLEEFEERLNHHTSVPGWECVLGTVNGEPIGYVYGYPLRGSGDWRGLLTSVDPKLIEETGNRTFGLCEIMVRKPWRKTGAAFAIHEELIKHRPEDRVNLLVEKSHPRVRALYERWDYAWFGEMQPSPEGPVYDSMMRPLRTSNQDRLGR